MGSEERRVRASVVGTNMHQTQEHDRWSLLATRNNSKKCDLTLATCLSKGQAKVTCHGMASETLALNVLTNKHPFDKHRNIHGEWTRINAGEDKSCGPHQQNMGQLFNAGRNIDGNTVRHHDAFVHDLHT